MLASLTSWLTASSLFLILNIVIGTIFLISRFTSSSRPQYHYHQPGPDYGAPPLARAPSLLERVKSFDFSFVHQSETQYTAQPPLEPVPSILERVKSIDFFHRFAHPNDEGSFAHPPESEYSAAPPPLKRAPSFLDRVKSINFSVYKFAPSYSEADYVSNPDLQDEAPQPDLPQLTRTPSFLERVKSIDFTSFYRSDSVKANPETEFSPESESDWSTDMIRDHGQVNRSKSERKETQRKLPEKIKKSASENSLHNDDEEEAERRRPAPARIDRRGLFGESSDVDAKADDFINRFKQFHKLERLASILRRREMLKGT